VKRAFIILAVTVCIMFCILSYKKTVDVDAHSGRRRDRVAFGPLVVREHVKPTRFSLMMCADDQCDSEPVWVRDGFRWFSTPYRSAGFIANLNHFALACEVYSTDRETQLATGRELLALVRDRRAMGLHQRVFEFIENARHAIEQLPGN
jgi:hypothetical protein